jgi:PAS domain S-box-containing protein
MESPDTAMYRILYVDDEPGLLEIGKIYLEDDGAFTVDTTLSPVDALDLLKSVRYDAIVSDYQMLPIDGITFLQTLRAGGNTTPFIIFTGKGREDVVIEALNSGADFYLQKGGEPTAQFAELAHKLHHAISRKQADSALEKSERDYRNLIEHANEAICVAQDGVLRMVNPRSIELSGYSEAELLNQPFTQYAHPDERRQLSDRFRRRIGGEPVTPRNTYRLCRKDRTTRWVELSAVTITWDGRPATLNFITDVTDRKHAEDALRESEERYRQFFKTTLDGLFITTPDARWIDFNDAIVEMFKCTSREEVFSSPLISFYVHPEKRPAFVERVEREGYVKEYPLQFRRRDGTVIDALMTVVPQKNPDGTTRAFIGTLRDITEQKHTGDTLQESEERYREFFRTTNDSVFITTPDGHWIDFNEALIERLGYNSRDEMSDIDVASAYAHPEERIAFLELVRRDGYVKEWPIQFRKQDGTILESLISIVAQTNPDGSVKAYIGTVRDITGRKRTENAFKERKDRCRRIFESLKTWTTRRV